MNYWDKKLVREQLDQKLKKFLLFNDSIQPTKGWIKTIREALNMSSTELAKRAKIHQSRISRIEEAEVSGDLKLSTLNKMADGLGMKFVYGFIPNKSMEDMMYQQARRIALKRMNRVSHTMKLEAQELNSEQEEKALEDIIQKILIDPPKDFWLI